MKAISHHGQPAIRTVGRDPSGEENPILYLLEVDAAIALRDGLAAVIAECSENTSRVKQIAAPEILAEDYTPASLIAAILMRKLPLPTWIQFGKSRILITPEDANGVVKGLMLAVEFASRAGE